MSELEKLAPDLKLCERIPDGAFSDSALVHARIFTGHIVVGPREAHIENDLDILCSAPTLAEIMEAFERAEFATSIFSCGVGWIAKAIKHNINEFKWDENPASAALKLWLELNEEEKSEKNG